MLVTKNGDMSELHASASMVLATGLHRFLEGLQALKQSGRMTQFILYLE